jgi:hypothetical protein
MRRFPKLSPRERKIEEMYRFVHQSHISKKNVARLRVLLDDADEGVRNMAYVLIRVAAVRPYKRKRLRYIVKVDRILAKEFVEMFFGDEWIDAPPDPFDQELSLGRHEDDESSICLNSASDESDVDIPF